MISTTLFIVAIRKKPAIIREEVLAEFVHCLHTTSSLFLLLFFYYLVLCNVVCVWQNKIKNKEIKLKNVKLIVVFFFLRIKILLPL